MWTLSRPGIEAVWPAFAGRFLTTVSPGMCPSSVCRGKVCHFSTDGPPWSIHDDHLSLPFLPRICQCMHSTYGTYFSSSNMSSVLILTQEVKITKTETVDTFKFTFPIHLYRRLPTLLAMVSVHESLRKDSSVIITNIILLTHCYTWACSTLPLSKIIIHKICASKKNSTLLLHTCWPSTLE